MGILRLLLLSAVAQQQLTQPRSPDAPSDGATATAAFRPPRQAAEAGKWATAPEDELFDDFDPDFAVAPPAEELLDICGEVNALDVAGDQAVAVRQATQLDALANELKYVFGTFSFKGFGVSFRKSMVSLRSTGVSLVLPMTTNFPVYDSRFYYPKVVVSMGVSTSSTCLWASPTFTLSITTSLPLRVYWMLVLLCTEEKQSFQTTAKRTKSIDSVKVGVSQ
jgi:hypothetical protein